MLEYSFSIPVRYPYVSVAIGITWTSCDKGKIQTD